MGSSIKGLWAGTCAGLALAAACSDPADPAEPGPLELPALAVTIGTTGDDLDRDGYRLSIDGGEPVGATVNGTVAFSGLGAGTHQVTVTDVARWCDVIGGPDQSVVLGKTGDHALEVRVNCRTTFRDWLMYDSAGAIRMLDLTGDPAQSGRLGYTEIPCQSACSSAAISANGETVAWATADGIEVMNADGTGRRSVVHTAAGLESSPSWAPDGARLAYLDNTGEVTIEPEVFAVRDVFIVRTDGAGAPMRITFDGARGPAWSPDGATIAFARGMVFAANHPLWLMDPSGQDLRLIGSGSAEVWDPSWSPDGSAIVYMSPAGAHQLRITSIDGTNVYPVGPEPAFYGAWARDGQRIALVTGDGCHGSIAVMTPAGDDIQALTASTTGDCQIPKNPAWGF